MALMWCVRDNWIR